MSTTEIYRRTDPRPPLSARLRQSLRVEADPSDAEYRKQHAVEMIEGFRVLSFLVVSAMTVLLIVHMVEPGGFVGVRGAGPSPIGCAILAGGGALGLLVSKWVRSAVGALVATAILLGTHVIVTTVDCLQEAVRNGGSRTSLIPILLAVLVLSAALLPLRPSRMLGLGVLLLATSGVAARVTNIPFQIDFVDAVGAAIAVAVSVATAARSTSDRIRVHKAHESAMQAQRQAEAARERALLAESAITMERLAASLSHELNTPIGVVRSATETLVRAVQRQTSFARGSSGGPPLVEQLLNAIGASTTRLTETVARIQRFANLDRSGVRLVDVNQLVQDAVALMNPPSANQTQIKLRLEPLPQIWCRPHALNVAIASILNTMLGNMLPVTIDTCLREGKVIVRIARCSTEAGLNGEPELCFAVVEGRIRASGWELFAARQLVRENGGDLRCEGQESSERRVTISLPASRKVTVQESRYAVAG